MKDFAGKTAFVTGGASGIGLGMAEAFVRRGVSVMLADVEQGPLDGAIGRLRGLGGRVEGVICDVADRAQVEAAARATLEAFGKVHIVCNNAGVGTAGPVGEITPADWDWIVSVNLMGVVYGVDAFLPHIRSHGEGGAFVNTASMSGLVSAPGMEPYSATKYAVVAMSEGWALQLAPEGIGVSVLCPGFVRTRIGESGRTRPERHGGPRAPAEAGPMGAQIAAGLDPLKVGERVAEAVAAKELYIITHPEMREPVRQRFERIMSGFDSAEASAALKG